MMASVEIPTVRTRITVAEALDILGMTAVELARKAGLNTATVRSAMIPGGRFKTNDTSAAAIADALGLDVDEIEWANGTSHLGRNAQTGVPIATRTRRLDVDMCDVHFVTLPANKVCDMCG